MNLAELIKKTQQSDRPNTRGLVEVAKSVAIQPTKPAIRPASVKKDAAWVSHLTDMANTEFGQKPEFGNASIELKVGMSKDTMVSLTPWLVYPDGTRKKPAGRANVGYATDRDFDKWLVALKTLLTEAHTSTPAPKKGSGLKKSVSYWTEELERLASGLTGEFETQVVNGKLTIRYNEASVCLRKDEDGLFVVRGEGNTEAFTSILRVFAKS